MGRSGARAPDLLGMRRTDRTMTPRQRQVMAEVASGDSYETVGKRLGISRQTVKNTVADVMKRYGVHTAIGFYAVSGWLRVPPYDVTYRYEAPDYE